MKHFQLNIVADQQPVKKALDLERKFSAIKIDSLNQNVQEILKLHNIRSLELTECTLDKQTLANALNNMKLLNNLTAVLVNFTTDNSMPVSNPAQLNYLKSFKLHQSDHNILGLISTTSLRSLTINSYIFQRENLAFTINLLKVQQSLENLTLCANAAETFFKNEDISDFPFQLKYLKISKTSLRNFHNPLINFLSIHQSSLKVLVLGCFISEESHKFILQHMTDITTLQMPQCFAPTKQRTFVSDIQPLTKVKHLKSLGSFNSIAQAKDILNLFPSLEGLDMSKLSTKNWFNEFLVSICDKFPHLAQLNIPSITSDNSVTFKHLRELHVVRVSDENSFNSFLRRHSNTLETLTIGWIDGAEFTRGVTIDAIKICAKLKHISISSDSPVVIRMFTKVTMNHSWLLESNFKVKKGLDMKWIRIVFRFPDDQALWLDKCTTWDDELIREFSIAENYGLNAFINKFK